MDIINSVQLTADQEAAIKEVIEEQEGGWQLSRDADGGDGGWTYAGVTDKTWFSFSGEHLTYEQAQMKQFSQQQIINIYCSEFVKSWMLQLPADLFGPIFSCEINCDKAGLIFQRAINRFNYFENLKVPAIPTDGIVGSLTFNVFKINVTDEDAIGSFLQLDFLHCWMEEYISICTSNPAKLVFLKGWHNRVEFWRKA